MANFTPASIASARTLRRVRIMVSMVFSTGPGGRLARSPATRNRTNFDPIPTGCRMPSRRRFMVASKPSGVGGSAPASPPWSSSPSRAAASLRSFQWAGSLLAEAEIFVGVLLHLLHGLEAGVLVVPDDHVGQVGSVVGWLRFGVRVVTLGI